jgi:hypothetical protein
VNVLTDPEHCGQCGASCASGAFCSNGACANECGAGTIECGPLCVNPVSDPAHCGGCDQACASDELCAGGNCVAQCPGVLVACLGGCVELDTDPNHCGGCGQKCAEGPCVSGSCRCTDGVKNGDETGPDCGGSCQACSVPVDADLVAYWRLDGDAQDASGNGNHGTVYGATSVTGKLGQGYQIAEGACIAVPDSSSLDMVGSSGFSMLAWIQHAGGCIADRGILVNKEETYEIGVECATNLLQEAIQLSDGAWTWLGTGAISTTTWQHVAITWDGTTVRHYVDATEVFSRSMSGVFADRTTGLGIGCRSVPADASGPGGSFFYGVIDEVALYKRGLFASEITAYYQATK